MVLVAVKWITEQLQLPSQWRSRSIPLYHAHKFLTCHHYTFIDKLLPGSFQTMAKISRVGICPPWFFPGWALANFAHPVPAPLAFITVRRQSWVGYGQACGRGSVWSADMVWVRVNQNVAKWKWLMWWIPGIAPPHPNPNIFVYRRISNSRE